MYRIGTMGPNDWAILFLFPFGLACLGLAVFLTRLLRSPRAVLLAWAETNGLELMEAHRRLFFFSFRLLYTGGQSIYRVRVRDARGAEQSGFARVGGIFGLGDHVKVAWDRDG